MLYYLRGRRGKDDPGAGLKKEVGTRGFGGKTLYLLLVAPVGSTESLVMRNVHLRDGCAPP